jgi:5-methylcytosine-specific restriction endonuclease McrA
MRKVNDDARLCDECRSERMSPSSDGIKTHSNNCVDGIHAHTASDRVLYAHLYIGERWKRNVQPKALKACPICARCNERLSELVDHIVPAGEAIRQAQESGLYPVSKYAGFYFTTNLQGLCRVCHGIKTLEDKVHRGPWPDVVAKEQAKPKKVWSF